MNPSRCAVMVLQLSASVDQANLLGTIVMINEPRSQYKEFMKRQETAGDIEEGTPTKTDDDGIYPLGGFELTCLGDVVEFNKRNAEPEVYMPRDGTNLEDPVRMDRFGSIDS
jgi:hypothetical protein